MMGIDVVGTTSVLCDNKSTIKKKHVAVAYHRVREAQAAGIVRIAHERSEGNLADILTKLLVASKLQGSASLLLR